MTESEAGAKSVQMDETTPLVPKDTPHNPSRDPPREEWFGYFLQACSVFSFGALGLIVRYVTGYHNFPFSCVMVIRGIFQTTFALFYIVWVSGMKSFNISRQHWGLVCARGIVGSLSLSFKYFAYSRLPMGIFTSVFILNVVFTMLLGQALLGEMIAPIEAGAALCSFLGVLLVAYPDMRLDIGQSHSGGFMIGLAAALAAAFSSAATYCLLRTVSTHVNFMVLVLAQGVSITMYGVLFGGASVGHFVHDDPRALQLIAFGCIFGILGSCCLNMAYKYCRAGTGTLVRIIDVPFSYLLGVVFLGEIPQPMSLVGSVFVLAGTGIVASRKLFEKK